MAVDDEEPRVRPQTLARPLDRLGVDELEAYVAELRAEIARAEAEIARKRDMRNAAQSVFRT